MTWVVTGAGGQLGLALSKQLTLEGVDFIPLLSNQLDITNVDQVNEVIFKLQPQVIVNTAAWTDVEGAETHRSAAFAVNERGVENLVLAARKVGAIFIHISTDYVFDGNSNLPWDEEAPTNPKNVYGLSKAAGENLLKRIYPERTFIVRTSWLYSEFGNNFAKTICNMALSSTDEIRVVNDQIGQPTSASELARQLILLVKMNVKFGIYHGTNCGQASWFEFAEEIFKLTSSNLERLIPVPASKYPTLAKRPLYSVLGQNSWVCSGIQPMQHWNIALKNEIPEIVKSVQTRG